MQARRYHVTVQGRLGARFADAFPGASVQTRCGRTRLVTEPFDQGQLHGLLNRIRDFGFDLLSVESVPDAPPRTHRRSAPSATGEQSPTP